MGHKLTASTGGIRDVDGLPSTFTYQWIRVNGASESDIANATASSYTLVTADRGKALKVKVGFTDGGGSAESQPKGRGAHQRCDGRRRGRGHRGLQRARIRDPQANLDRHPDGMRASPSG